MKQRILRLAVWLIFFLSISLIIVFIYNDENTIRRSLLLTQHYLYEADAINYRGRRVQNITSTRILGLVKVCLRISALL